MAQSLNRIASFPLWYDLIKNGKSAWNSCRSCCTWLMHQRQIQSQLFTSSSRICVVGSKSAAKITKRMHQTLPRGFDEQLPSSKQIEQFLSSRKLIFEHGHTSLIASCPLCANKEERSDNANERTLYINKTTGSHFCKNCGSSGTWSQFKVNKCRQ